MDTSPYLSPETCIKDKKQHLELDMEQQNDLKLRKEFIKAVYCHLAYLTNTQSNVYASQVAKNLSVNAGDTGLILGSGRSPGEGNSNPLRYSCLENSMDRGDGQATVHGAANCQTHLSN